MKTKYQKELKDLGNRFDYYVKSFNKSKKENNLTIMPTLINEMKNTKNLIDYYIQKERENLKIK